MDNPWQPAATAPRDKGPIIAVMHDWYTGRQRPFLVEPIEGDDGWETAFDGNQTFEARELLTWMPLPVWTIADLVNQTLGSA